MIILQSLLIVCCSLCFCALAQAKPVMDLASAKALAVSAPRVEYPYEARAKKITGSGVYVMTINPATGLVTSVAVARGSGHKILDREAVITLKRWRFKPATVTKVRLPVTWSMP